MKFKALKLIAPVLFLLAIASCKKDDTAGPNTPAAPHHVGNATINAVPLNGGSPLGRWTSILYHGAVYQNDTFQYESSDTAIAGEEIIKFLSNGTTELHLDTMLMDVGTYVVNQSTMTMYFTSDTLIVQFGISGNSMRWHIDETHSAPPNVIREVTDILFERW
jgi:hypothetical protein